MCPSPKRTWKAWNAAQRQVRMNLPEGMLEINAPVTAEEKREQAGSERRKKQR